MMPDDHPATIPAMLAATARRVGNEPALGTIRDGEVRWQTWGDVSADVRRLGLAMHRHGVAPGDRVVQISANRAEWIITDLAILAIGAVHVPLHVSLSAEQLAEQIGDCEARLVFLSGDVLESVADKLDDSRTIVCYDSKIAADLQSAGIRRSGSLAAIVMLPEFLADIDLSTDNSQSGLLPPKTGRNPKSDDLATLLYTSGTTGRPRGVMLSHANLTSNAIAASETMGAVADESRLCILPLSHIYARTCDLYSWLYRGSRLVLAESRETVFRDCRIAKPTVLNGVPYFYQKVVQQVAAGSAASICELLGGRLSRCFAGGAAVAPETEAQFAEAGLPVLTGYGLTETSPVVTATSPETYQAGTVGRPLQDVEVQLADDGEILVRGPNVMRGYWRDEAATRETIVDGWLHTGDLGAWDQHGNLRIIGRKKEIIVLSTGKNVSPTRVEQLLSGSLLFESVCVVGDGKKCLGALIVPNPDALRKEIRERRLWVWSRRRALTHPRVRQLYRQEIDRLLTSASREEQIGPFAILGRAFSSERGETTAKLSLRRDVITANFADEIAKLFDK